MTLNFRTGVKEDAPKIADWLMQPGVLRYFPMIDLVEVEDSVRILHYYIGLGASIICEKDGVTVGVAVLYVNFYEKMKHQSLFMILVDEAYRGQGIGTKLLQETMQLAKTRFGIRLLHLEVYEGNPALSLYQREGFTEYGRHPHFLKENGEYLTKILMEKKL